VVSSNLDPPMAGNIGSPDATMLEHLGKIEGLEWLLTQARVAVQKGKPGSVAHTQAIRAAAQLHADIVQARLDLAASQEVDRSTLSSAEWLEVVARDAQTCSMQELEVYVGEWLQREGLEIDEQQMRLVPARPRLVEL
jgi:hypothetical protein